ncbi:MAG: hypothetical protein WD045_15570 [Pirellulaceae bacterium]
MRAELYCCDCLAVVAFSAPLEYAKSLEAIATWQLGHASNLLATPFLGERMMHLLDRVRRVLGTDSPAKARKAWPLGLAILATPLLLWAFSLGMLPGQRTEVVAEGELVKQPRVQYGVGVNSDAGVTGEIISDSTRQLYDPRFNHFLQHQGNIPAMQFNQGAQVQLAQAPSPGPNQSQRSAEPESSDLSPRDRAMLQMMTELRFEVMALRNEIRQLRQPGGGNQPQYHPPMPHPGGYGTMPSLYPQQPQSRPQYGTPPPTTYHAQPHPEVMPPRDQPEERDKPEKKNQGYTPRSSRTGPHYSKPQEGDEAEEKDQARFSIPTAEERYSFAPPEGSGRQIDELQERLRTSQALTKEAQQKAEEARHQTQLAEERAKEEIHRVQALLNKAALRIKELEDQAAAKAAESTPTETPAPSGKPITPQPNPVE